MFKILKHSHISYEKTFLCRIGILNGVFCISHKKPEIQAIKHTLAKATNVEFLIIEDGAKVGKITCEGVEYTYQGLREAMGL